MPRVAGDSFSINRASRRSFVVKPSHQTERSQAKVVAAAPASRPRTDSAKPSRSHELATAPRIRRTIAGCAYALTTYVLVERPHARAARMMNIGRHTRA